jgi:hypothetical protein
MTTPVKLGDSHVFLYHGTQSPVSRILSETAIEPASELRLPLIHVLY